jgi:nucleotide-binding universal stress UspA family protein
MRLRRAIVGVDFSERSLVAARWAAAHLAPGAEVVLTHVLRGPQAPRFLEARLAPMLDVLAELAPALHGALRGLAESIGPDRTSIDMREGRPWDGLADAATALDADAIILGRVRHRRGSARFGATTAQRLIARTRLPVIVVPSAQPTPARRVLAALDDDDHADGVMAAAEQIAAAQGARVEMLHVIAPELHAFVRACASRSSEGGLHPDELQASVQGWMRAHGRDAADAWTRVGDAGQEIIARARVAKADLVVIGRGGHAGAPSCPRCAIVPGSTTRLVMWAAPCPVLVTGSGAASRGGAPEVRNGRRMLSRNGRVGARTAASSPRPDGVPPAARLADACPTCGAA